jgi:hypothetical protein
MCLLIKTAIEVMASKETRPDIVPLLMEQCKAHGFSPFHVKKDSNGYIYNRYLLPALLCVIFTASRSNMCIATANHPSESGPQSNGRPCLSPQKESPHRQK